MTADTLPLLAQLRAAGASFNRIAATLNARGVPSRKGGRWFAASVRHALMQGAAPTPSKQ